MFREWSSQDLMEELTSLAAHIHAATARFLELVAELDRRGVCVADGARSTAHWVAFTCGIGANAAREHVRVARALQGLPLVRAAFSEGRLSYAKVRALTRVEDVADEASLLGLALDATAAQLERLVRAWRGIAAREDAAERLHEQRSLMWFTGDDGALELRGRFAPEDGQMIVAVLESLVEQLDPNRHASPRPTKSVSAETPEVVGRVTRDSLGALRADALVALVETSRVAGAGGDRCQLVVHIDAATLSTDQLATCELEHGEPLAVETVRRLACDASVVALTERAGTTLSVGRKTRTIPAAIRRALRSRDHGCRFPGCTQTRGVDAHHIHHWAHGGETELGNLVQLCRYHHRLVHEGGFSVERLRANALVFRRPDGRRVVDFPRLPRGSHASLYEAHHREAIRIGPNTCRPRYPGPMDLAACVDRMSQITTTFAIGI